MLVWVDHAAAVKVVGCLHDTVNVTWCRPNLTVNEPAVNRKWRKHVDAVSLTVLNSFILCQLLPKEQTVRRQLTPQFLLKLRHISWHWQTAGNVRLCCRWRQNISVFLSVNLKRKKERKKSPPDLLCLRSCRSEYNASTINYLLVFSTLRPTTYFLMFLGNCASVVGRYCVISWSRKVDHLVKQTDSGWICWSVSVRLRPVVWLWFPTSACYKV